MKKIRFFALVLIISMIDYGNCQQLGRQSEVLKMPLGFTVFFLINIDNDLPQGLKEILNELIQQVKNLENEVKKNGEKLDQIMEHQSMANSIYLTFK